MVYHFEELCQSYKTYPIKWWYYLLSTPNAEAVKTINYEIEKHRHRQVQNLLIWSFPGPLACHIYKCPHMTKINEKNSFHLKVPFPFLASPVITTWHLPILSKGIVWAFDPSHKMCVCGFYNCYQKRRCWIYLVSFWFSGRATGQDSGPQRPTGHGDNFPSRQTSANRAHIGGNKSENRGSIITELKELHK